MVPARINTFVIIGPGDCDIIMGSARQDLSKMETGIRTFDRGEAIISTIGIPFPVSTRIHKSGDYIAGLNTVKNKRITDGLATRF